jgi:hypothetical protein
VYSALVLHEGRFERRDIAAEAWAGWDQAQALSWWRRTVPVPQKRPERLRLDPQALLRIFADLADTIDPAQQRFRYIVALCLLRARKLVMDGIERTADGSVLVVHERGGASHRLPDPALKPEDEAQLTEQLMAVAGDQAAPLGTQEPA